MQGLSQIITKIIDFFYQPFSKYVPQQLFRYAACGGGNMVLDWVLYFVVYNFVVGHELVYITLPFMSEICLTPHIMSLLIVFPITLLTGFWLNKYITFTDEVFAITSFNAAGEIIDFDIIHSGDLTSVGFSMRKIIETVIERKATAVVLSHNHPQGNAMPSNEDIASTIKIKEVLEGIGIKLLDHIIIAEGDGVSLRQSQKYYSLFK
jgi:putative flippase GtrA